MSETTEQEALDAILGEVFGEEEHPQVEGQVQEVIENEPTVEEQEVQVEDEQPVVEQEIQEPIVEDEPQEPSKTDILMEKIAENQNALAEQNRLLKEKLLQPQEAKEEKELTDDEIAMLELRKQLGIDDLLQENTQLKQALEEQVKFKEQIEQQQQEMQYQQSIQSELLKVKQERPHFNEQAIAEYINKQPEHLRSALDTPEGWRMVDDLVGKPQQQEQKPDQITPTTQDTPPTKTVFERKKRGENVDEIDLVSGILGIS
jgi:hypothetical protein